MKLVVTIEPRVGVDPRQVVNWLEVNFQQPGQHGSESPKVTGGNPLVNAEIGLTVIQ